MIKSTKTGTNGNAQRLVVDATEMKAGRLTLAEFRRAGRNKADLGAAQAEENRRRLAEME